MAEPTAGRVLIVDDDRMSRQLYGRLLERNGHTVQSAASAREGLTLLGTHQFDVVLLDLVMPEVSGLDFLREMSASGRARPEVIVTSSLEDSDALRACRAMGVYRFLRKPLLKPSLLSAVRSALQRSRG